MKGCAVLLVIIGIACFSLAFYIRVTLYDGFPQDLVDDLRNGVLDERTGGIASRVQSNKNLSYAFAIISAVAFGATAYLIHVMMMIRKGFRESRLRKTEPRA